MALEKEEKLQGISLALVVNNDLTKKDAIKYLMDAKSKQLSIAQYLTSNNIISALTIAQIISKDFGIPMMDLNAIDKSSIPEKLISDKLIQRHNIIPLFNRGDNLYIGLEDPSTQSCLKEVQFHTGLNTYGIVIESDKLHILIDKMLNEKENEALGDYLDDSSELDSLEISSKEEDEEVGSGDLNDDAPIVRFVHKMLLDAVKKGASDLHFEPYESSYRIRFRQDGILFVAATPPINLANRITARIKVMSNLDISERRIPQDGRFKIKISRNRSIDFRVSTCPTVGGEKVVMRILDPSSTKVGIDALGFDTFQRDHFMRIIKQPQGMVLVTGPTGSGKTVTLYTALNILNEEDINISTAEDPVEIKVAGINQVNMHPKVGLDFSNTLRSFLRQDPDVIMVGEIRDIETAGIAVKAAQTGHMVLSTLHTNSAAETLTRLVNMGIPPFNIAGSVSLIIAQRLGRKLCPHCKSPKKEVPEDLLIREGFLPEDIKSIKIMEPVGCDLCNNGYKGRVGLFEVMPITAKLGQIIMELGNSMDIEKVAKMEGMTTIRQAGLNMVKEGISSLEEINRVTKD